MTHKFRSDLASDWAKQDAQQIVATATGEEIRWVEVSLIDPNPKQPRRLFDETKLRELADDIGRNGILEPLLGTFGNGDRVTLIVGERRFRAAKMKGIPRVPMIIRCATPDELENWAISENLKRADLHPIEEALLFHRQIERFGSQEEAARRLGLNRATMALKSRFAALDQKVLDRLLSLPNLSFRQLRPLAGMDPTKIDSFIQKLEEQERTESDNPSKINNSAIATGRNGTVKTEILRFQIKGANGSKWPSISVKVEPDTTAAPVGAALASLIRELSSRGGLDQREIVVALQRELKQNK